MSDDVFKFLKEMLEEVEKETKDKTGDRYYTWSEHYNNWIDIAKALLTEISEFEKYNSLVLFRFLELQNQLLWILISILYGRYHHAIRELRYILDSMSQAYYLDKEHPQADMICKLEIVKETEREAYGTRLIGRLDITSKRELRDLYSALSKYVHSSYEELRPAIEEGKVDSRITFAFDAELFNMCVSLTNKVMDAIYFIVINRFPQIAIKIKEDVMTVKSLQRFGCDITLRHLKIKSQHQKHS